MNQLVTIPFHGNQVQAVDVDGTPHVVFRPLVESIGLDYRSQSRRLTGKSWASMVKMTMQVPGDVQFREHTLIDVRTLTMWLATIDENRVSDEARPLVVAYQAEIADVIESYWTAGGAINPRADEHQVNALIYQARAQMELAQAARGLIHPDHLEARARIILARGLGEAPELDAGSRPLYAQEFLREKNLSKKQLASIAGVFGKRLKRAYVEKHGREPEKYDLNVSNGQVRRVNGYTEADRPLMERVWRDYFAAVKS
ncbi:phage antirepressor N-terminal domain-containing protein [Corynebacterium sp. HMSC11E11]|uniref:phage antirepressor N-terminal domain-containing protein n=1 Tax=Corynebacterium sp. HMSC11E11 TaxID=1581089 RepID=UPI0008A49280|nr:phage antirepressor [Corynebacterium sp. HMSC11E11]